MAILSKVKPKRWSRSESESEEGVFEFRVADPKPCDLPVSRVKSR